MPDGRVVHFAENIPRKSNPSVCLRQPVPLTQGSQRDDGVYASPVYPKGERSEPEGRAFGAANKPTGTPARRKARRCEGGRCQANA